MLLVSVLHVGSELCGRLYNRRIGTSYEWHGLHPPFVARVQGRKEGHIKIARFVLVSARAFAAALH